MSRKFIPIPDRAKERELWLHRLVRGTAKAFLEPSTKVRKNLKVERKKPKRKKREKRNRVSVVRNVQRAGKSRQKMTKLFDSEKWKNWSGHDSYVSGPIVHPQIKYGFTKKTKQWAKEHRKGFTDVRIKTEGFIRPLVSEYPIRVIKPNDPKQGFFGSYPAPIGIHHLYTLELTSSGLMVLGMNNNLIMPIIHKMRYLFRVIQLEAEKIIELKIPSDTGKLRESFIKSISDKNSIFPKLTVGSLNDIKIRMRWFSELEYAGIVNKMPTDMVRHHRNQKIKSWRTGNFLHDPEAVGNFFYSVKYKIQREIRNKWYPQFIDSVYTLLKNQGYNFKFGKLGVHELFRSKTI